jgi:acetoin:2,6-dichlorophenolindophenol oxidoreductase subunit beta
VPGIKIVAPSTPSDAKALLTSAIRDDNPVLFLEHKRLYALKGNVDAQVVPLGAAATVRAGTDITIVTAMKSVHDALAAAETLAESGIDAEVIDLRTLRPFDLTTILDSVTRTKRILVVEEGPRTGGWAAEVLASVVEQRIGSLQMAWRLAMPDVPLPYSPPLEDAFLPDAARITASVLQRLGAASVSTGAAT